MFQLEAFRPAIADLQSAHPPLSNNFLGAILSSRSVTESSDFNWFDDSYWQSILNNWKLYVTIAKEGGCKGIIVDPEQYGTPLFSYVFNKEKENRSFEAYQAQVQKRGKELMEVTTAIFPEITLLFLYGYTIIRPKDSLDTASYGLYPAFLDGILQGAKASTTLIDGYEQAYGYTRAEHFEKGYEDITKRGAQLSQSPSLYSSKVQAGFGLWLDFGGRDQWNKNDFTQNHFSPSAFKNSLQMALNRSDSYVWVYSHLALENLPKAYMEAIEQL